MPDGPTMGQKITETIKELPPNLDAIMFWLKAYKPEIYNVKSFKRLDFVSNNGV